MKGVVQRVGAFGLKMRRNRFQTLVRSIISQQISTAAARTIQGRLKDRLSAGGISPESLVDLGIEGLRETGVSRQKASYILDLSEKSQNGEIRFHRHRRMNDEAVIEELVQVRGIGEWTAQMFLIFSLGRPDVLATDDLGIRQAIRQAYDLSDLPKPKECTEIGQPWRPYASMACWYLWRSLDTA